MAKFTFAVNAGIALYTEVEAETLEAAIEEVQARGVVSLCHQCAHGNSEEEWTTSGELDCGDPSVWELGEVFCDGEDITEKAKEIWGG